MIHNLLPNRDKVYITYDIDFIPDSSPAAKKIHRVKTLWLDVEGGKAYPVFDVHRGSRPRRALHLPRRRARRVRRRARAQHAGRPARRRAGRDGRPPPPRRPLHRPQAHARRAHGQPVPLEGALLGAGRRGVVGRGDDRDDAQVAREGQARRRPQRLRHLRLQARVLVRVDGDRPGGVRARRAAAASTRSRASSTSAARSPTATCARTATTAARSPASPTRASWPPARSPPPRSRSPTSSTARATC